MTDYKRLAPRTAIITILEEEGTVTFDRIATLIGKGSDEIERTLQALENQGIVRCRGNKVSLVGN